MQPGALMRARHAFTAEASVHRTMTKTIDAGHMRRKQEQIRSAHLLAGLLWKSRNPCLKCEKALSSHKAFLCDSYINRY